MGIGRAPGGDSAIIKALHTSSEDAFLKTDQLINYLTFSRQMKLYNSVIAVPSGSDIPEIWILGTSPDSAMYAAGKGLRYAFGSFINDEHILQCFQVYYQNFKPSQYLKEPYLNLALFVICGDTETDAVRMAKSSEYWIVHNFLKGLHIPFPDEKTALEYKFTPEEKMFIDYRRRSAVIGDAKTVSQQLNGLIKKYAIHELTVVTIVADHEDRKNSYRLLSASMDNVQ